jgi:outer membrane protein TolC
MKSLQTPSMWMAASVSLAAALGGCRVGPEFQAPQTDVPARSQNGPSSLSASWPRPDWWTSFGSRQLDELVEKGKRDNTDLAGAAARIRQGGVGGIRQR